MQIIRDPAELTREIAALRVGDATIAFVPTMGALHAGHMALVAEARRPGTQIVASIFVNPTQFAASEDLSTYPRREAADAAMLEGEGVAILWAPDAATMYPDGVAAPIQAAAIGDDLEGAARPGHFDGVATVVARLFDQVRPDVALFGEKDYQQLTVIRRWSRSQTRSKSSASPPSADEDGLALSSRNAYLRRGRIAARPCRARSARQHRRSARAATSPTLKRPRPARSGGVRADRLCRSARCRDAGAAHYLDRPARLLAAARVGRTRLIDNLAVLPRY